MNSIDQFIYDQYRFNLLFSTSSSACFEVTPTKQQGLSSGKKWLSVHYPCNGHIKLQVRGSFKLEPKQISAFVSSLIEILGVASDATYEYHNFVESDVISLGKMADSSGASDRIETTRKFFASGDRIAVLNKLDGYL